jgi:hypothetical protein
VAFLASPARTWCEELTPHAALAGAHGAWLARLHKGFVGLVLLFEPDTALLIQTRPGAQLEDVLDAASTVHAAVLED